MQDPNAEITELAQLFIEQTERNLFITGKAGTGKTHFLNEQSRRTTKKKIILAPTGIAAVNAGGVTINSLFQLPPGTYVPTIDQPVANVYSIPAILGSLNYSLAKRNLLRSLDLIFIDEVSMLRSDQVSVIDAILKKERNNTLPFGGVQILFIGDLYQLPPVLPSELAGLYAKYYRSEFFFDSGVIQANPLLQIELPHVHRQSDPHFIALLNRIRSSELTDADLAELNKRVSDQPDGRYVTNITSHVDDAVFINNEKLGSITGEQRKYEAIVSGNFKEANFSAEKILTLKVGAQVMLIRNDTNSLKDYYNGKTGEISFMTDNKIGVRFKDGLQIEVVRSTWQSLDYSNGSVEVAGELQQFPLKLAWAVTIHKSQGLTFDHAIIDAARSFAPGQVYVAISRIRSLNGLKLRTPLTAESIRTNPLVSEFLNPTPTHELVSILEASKISHWLRKLLEQFNVADERSELVEILNKPNTYKQRIDTKVLVLLEDSAEVMDSLRPVWVRFCEQVMTNTDATLSIQWLEERVDKAIEYFTGIIFSILSKLANYEGVMNDLSASLLASINTSLTRRIEQIRVAKQWVTVYKVNGIEEALKMANRVRPSDPVPKITIHAVSSKRDTGNSSRRTVELFLSGKTITEISSLRRLSVSTIESHLLEAIKKGQLLATSLMDEAELKNIEEKIKEIGYDVSNLKESFGDKYSFFSLRLGIVYAERVGA